jgi:hypothetical protein
MRLAPCGTDALPDVPRTQHRTSKTRATGIEPARPAWKASDPTPLTSGPAGQGTCRCPRE